MTSDQDGIIEDLRPLARPLSDIKLDPRNARAHDPTSVAALCASLSRFGQRKPIVLRRDPATGDLVAVEAGNGTVTAARELGWSHIAAVVVQEDEHQGNAYALADNRTAELSSWGALAPEIFAEVQVECPEIDFGAMGLDDQWVAAMGSLDDPLGLAPGGAVRGAGGEEPPPPPDAELGGDPATKAPPSYDEHLPTERPPPKAKVGDVLELGPHTLHCDDCIAVMDGMDPDSIDAVVTDPPYGLSPDGKARTWDELEVLRAEGKGPKGGFMGKEWDAGVPGITWARSLFRVMKPGAHAVIFSANRTIHRLTCALEDAGFEVRDQIGWVTWSGFPKSRDVSKAIDEEAGAEREVVGLRKKGQSYGDNYIYGDGPDKGGVQQITAPATPEAKKWDGWGTALKPAMEPAILVRKPISERTVAQNVLKHGTGALNIDACRIGYGDPAWPGPGEDWHGFQHNGKVNGSGATLTTAPREGVQSSHSLGRWPANIYATPKASRSEREEGCDSLDPRERAELTGRKPGSAGLEGSDGSGNNPYTGANWKKPIHNYHPTVKPRRLIEWLVTLVTPPEGVVFDPFAGSGTIFVAATGADRKAIGVELDPGHCDICEARAVSAMREGPK